MPIKSNFDTLLKKYDGFLFDAFGVLINMEASLPGAREAIERIKPSVVALELDQARLSALMSGKKRKMRWSDIMKVGWKGFLFNSIGAWIEKKFETIQQSDCRRQ